MTLLDHFHSPLRDRRHWHSFHNAWATYLASHLNEQLPPNYFAESNVQFGIEVDVATYEENGAEVGEPPTSGSGAAATWAPPAPALTIPFSLEGDLVEIAVYETEAGPALAGAIELIGPSNKDRPAHRQAFVTKCESYLLQGIGLILVDIVTSRTAQLHNELMTRIMSPESARHQDELYASAYHPLERDGEVQLDLWFESLEVGRSLPTLPLWLRGGLCFPVDLQLTYERTCEEQRVAIPGS